MKSRLYYSKKDLERQGWTKGLFERFNLEPDKEAPNPYDSSRPNMKLYSKQKVQEIEQTDEFQKQLEWTTWFRGHMKEVAQRKKNN